MPLELNSQWRDPRAGNRTLEQIISFLFKYRASDFANGQFGFSARPSIPVILLIGVVVLVLAYLLYPGKTSRLQPAMRALLITLRAMLIVVVLFCLIRPVIIVASVTPQSTFAAVLMDDSASMLIADEGGDARLQAAKRLMSADSPFLRQLAEKFKVRSFKFSAAVEPARDASELGGSGQQTDLTASIEQALRELAGLPVSGITLITDGAQTAESDVAETISDLRARGIPVFVIGVGDSKMNGDVELVRATAPRRVLSGSNVTAELLIRATGIPDKSIKIDLAEDNHTLRSQVVPLQGSAATEVVRVAFTPSSPGLHRYTITAGPLDSEPVKENNSQQVLVEVESSHPRILYVEGEPRWEFGKLRGALSDEKNVILVSLLRTAEGKFYRQGIDNPEELNAGFPKSEEDLFKFDSLIIGSVEASFFTFDQLRTIEQFVSRRGAALLALAGPKSFVEGGYGNTPIADLLPVFLPGSNPGGSELQSFKPIPSARGRDHPILRLNDNAEANAKTWQQMPALTIPQVLTDPKPGATILLEAQSTTSAGMTAPMLVEQRYGRGRTLALLASDTWRWRMLLESNNKSYETFWRNTLRYLVESIRRRVEVQPDRGVYAKGEVVRFRAEISDKSFMHVPDAQVTARISTPLGETLNLRLNPAIDGEFEGYVGTVAAEHEGTYKIEINAMRGNEALGFAQANFIAGQLNREAFGAAQNRELLQRIASETGGRYYTVDEAGNLVEDMARTETSYSVRSTLELWDMPFNFALIVGIAAAEWFIRKRKGLA